MTNNHELLFRTIIDELREKDLLTDLVDEFDMLERGYAKLENGICLIPLTQGYFAKVDEEDLERVTQQSWYATVDKNKSYETVYARSKVNGRAVALQRFILELEDPELVGEHLNHDGLDNRKANLRIVTKTQSMQNLRGSYHNKHGNKFKRVHRHSGKNGRWRAVIKANNVKYDLGSFATPEEAARAYDAKACELHGEFAVLNFPLEGHNGLREKDPATA